MADTRGETTSIAGNWPLDQYKWKTEQAKLMERFMEGLKEKKVLGLKCSNCGLVYSPPKPICRCLARPEEWVEVSDEGEVTTFTFTGAWSWEGKPEEEGESLIVVGVKRDGSDTMSLAVLEGADPDDVKVGMRVKVKWPDDPRGALEDLRHVMPAD